MTGNPFYEGIVETRQEAARLRAREQQAVVLRHKLAETHRAVARVQRSYAAVADRKDAAWAKVLKACELLLELQGIERKLAKLSPVASLPYRASVALIPQLVAQAHGILLKDETAQQVAGHYSGDAYKMAALILKMAKGLPSGRGKRTSKTDRLPFSEVLRRAAKKPRKRAVVTRTAPRTKGLGPDARAMLGLYGD